MFVICSIPTARIPPPRIVSPDAGGEAFGQDVLEDEGVADKRLLVIEQEFQRVMRVMSRDANTLSAILRDAWDGNILSVMTKKDPTKATGATISIVAHITFDELKAEMCETLATNGFGNRFLFCLAKRSKRLPLGGNVDAHAFSALADRLRDAIRDAPKGQISFDAAATEEYCKIYHAMGDHPGIFGSLTARNEAQICRIALIYALLDGQHQIGVAHLKAANEIVRYSSNSVHYTFGDATGNYAADTILSALINHPDGLSRTEISSSLFHRNISANTINSAIALLVKMKTIQMVQRTGRGRPTEMWQAI